MTLRTRALRLILGLGVVAAALVAAHPGERVQAVRADPRRKSRSDRGADQAHVGYVEEVVGR